MRRCSRPGSHSSPGSTREFPHTLMFRLRKQDGALDWRRFRMDRLLQLENNWRTGEGQVEDRWGTAGGQLENRWRTGGGQVGHN